LAVGDSTRAAHATTPLARHAAIATRYDDDGQSAGLLSSGCRLGGTEIELRGNALRSWHAAATDAALNVVEPYMSGLGGGGGFISIYEAKSGTVHTPDYVSQETWR